MKKPSLILAAVVALCLSVSFAQAGDLKTVVYKDAAGQEVTKVGQIVKDAKNPGYYILTLMKGGVKMLEISIKETDVVSMTDYVSPAEDYLKRSKAIESDTDSQKHFELATWAFENSLYKECVEQSDISLKLKPGVERVELLKRQAEAMLSAQNRQAESGKSDSSGTGVETGTATGTGTGVTTGTDGSPAKTELYTAKNLLDEQQMNRVMLEELRNDDKVTVTFQNNVVEKYIQNNMFNDSDESKNAFRNLAKTSPVKAAVRMRNDGNVNSDIIIKGTPIFLQEFKSNVWPIIRRNGSCGESSCHGGPNFKGGFFVLNPPSPTDQYFLTNFAILTTYQDSHKRWMLSRERPEDSLLLNFVLGIEQTQTPHPKILNQANSTMINLPTITTKDNPGYKKMYDWVVNLGKDRTSRSMVPDFGLSNWSPPAGVKLTQGGTPGSASQPASTMPTSAPSGTN